MATVDYVPPRGTVSAWGDSYGNRVDRFLAGIAYLDGQRPSADHRARLLHPDGDRRLGLPRRQADPALDVRHATASGNSAYAGQGNHQLSVADVDGDGTDEIVYGSMAVDDNGGRLWTPARPRRRAARRRPRPGPAGPGGVQGRTRTRASRRRPGWHDAAHRRRSSGACPPTARQRPRRVRRHLSRQRRAPSRWALGRPTACGTPRGTNVSSRKPGSTNFAAWWDGDPLRELLDGTAHRQVRHRPADTRLLTGLRRALQQRHQGDAGRCPADILGDWREEVVWPHGGQHGAADLHARPTPTDARGSSR